MSQFLETIKCKDGRLYNLSYHNARMNNVIKEYFGINEKNDLPSKIEIPENCRKGLFRCRIIYSEDIEKIEFIPHQYRTIESLKIVENNEINYHFKYANRDALQKLFNQREDCDDILIVQNRCITDSSTANAVFFDGKKWWTPNAPLLKGTQREKLLNDGIINARRITSEEITQYLKVGLINALQNFENMPVILIKNIKF